MAFWKGKTLMKILLSGGRAWGESMPFGGFRARPFRKNVERGGGSGEDAIILPYSWFSDVLGPKDLLPPFQAWGGTMPDPPPTSASVYTALFHFA